MVAADLGSIRAAAEALNLTVSAVSHRIQVLETEIGNKVFDRSGQKLALTAVGARYRQELQPALATLQGATRRVRSVPNRRRLQIASVPLFYSHWLLPRLRAFMAAEPDIPLDLLQLNSRKAANADIVIRPLYRTEPASSGIRLFEWEITPICHPSLVERDELHRPEDLGRSTLIDLSTSLRAWGQWLASAGQPNVLNARRLVVDSFPLVLDAACRGLGVAISATAFVRHFGNDELVRPFEHSVLLPGGMYLNAATGNESAMAQTFRAWICAEAGVVP